MVDRFANDIWNDPFAGNIWGTSNNNIDPGFDPKYPVDVNKIDPYFGSRGWKMIPGIPGKAIGPDGQVYL